MAFAYNFFRIVAIGCNYLQEKEDRKRMIIYVIESNCRSHGKNRQDGGYYDVMVNDKRKC